MSTTTPKTRVAVLYGGRSSEHEVSLRSAANVIQNLDRERFDVVPIGIDREGAWYLGDDSVHKALADSGTLQLTDSPEQRLFNPNHIVAPERSTALTSMGRLFDVVFPVIHGPLCEDGTIQGLLEIADLPYVGCGVLASAMGMDKDISKRIVRDAGINVPDFVTVKAGQWQKYPQVYVDAIQEKLSFPVFVKPSNTGSSVGVIKVKQLSELKAAIDTAFQFDTKVIIEQGIEGMEIEISVLESLEDGCDPFVSVVGEIRPQGKHEFYSYAAKYEDEDGARIIIPAPISAEMQTKVQQVVKKIFAVLECEGMARVDLFLEKDTNHIYFNEVNTLPGFTEISMYPKLIVASGVSYQNLLTHLVDLAMSRQERRRQLQREYAAI